MPSDSYRMDDAITGIAVTYGWERPWFDQWWVALYWADQVGRCYAGRPDPPHDTSGWALMAREAALALCHVMDWLAHDPNVPLAEDQLRTIVGQNKWLQLATDIANTTKHHTRSQPSAAAAKISGVSVSGTIGTRIGRMTIERRRNGNTEVEDALDLVQGGVAEWRAVLADHDITDPYPNGIYEPPDLSALSA